MAEEKKSHYISAKESRKIAKENVKITKEFEKRKKRKKVLPKKVVVPAEETPVDDGYDGYYDDVLPPDLDREREGLDKELIKKIVALGVGVVFIIAMCVVMMYVL